MEYNAVILAYDCGVNNELVKDSPNFHSAGKGLIIDRAQTISIDNALPYWGKLYVHNFIEQSIEDVNLEDKYRERLVNLIFQLFLTIAIGL